VAVPGDDATRYEALAGQIESRETSVRAAAMQAKQ
jgi:hypothetical protein